MKNQSLINQFVNAVNTWKAYVIGLKTANKRNDSYAKSVLGKAVFKWRKEAERLKKMVDRLVRKN